MYYSVEDAPYVSKRLDETVVNTKAGDPVYISAVVPAEKTLICRAFDLKTQKFLELPFTDIDLTPIKLGWVNTGGSAVYVSRKPIRDVWKQGTCAGNICVCWGDLRTLKDKDFYNTIMGIYPTMKEALVQTGLKERVAFSRTFAVSKNTLFFKNKKVGKITPTKRFELFPDVAYLQEVVDEMLDKERMRK